MEENIKPEFIALMELAHRTKGSERTKLFATVAKAGDIKRNLNNLEKIWTNTSKL